MKISTRMLLFNKYLALSFLLLFFVSFSSWAIFSEYFSALLIWDMSHLGITKEEYMQRIFSFSNYPVDGFSLIQLILPIFSMIIILPYLNIKRLFAFSYTRIKSYKKLLIYTILKYVFIGSLVLFLSYLVFLLIGVIILPMKEDTGVPRELFSEILGKDFYNRHMILYFILEGFIKYFVFTFVYCLFSISISFLKQKPYVCVLIPLLYYAVGAIVIAVLESAFEFNLLFLSPTYTVMSNSREYINGILILLPLLPPLIFSVVVIANEIFKIKVRDDMYAII